MRKCTLRENVLQSVTFELLSVSPASSVQGVLVVIRITGDAIIAFHRQNQRYQKLPSVVTGCQGTK